MSHQSLTSRGYVLKKKYLTEKEKNDIHRELTFRPLVNPAYQKFAKPQPFSTYLESDLRLYLPRYWAIQKFGPPKKDHLLDHAQKTDFQVHWDLLPHQQTAWEAMEKQFLEKKSGGVLCLPCGLGKTYLSIRMAAYLGYKTIVIVNKEFLMKQWIRAIQACSNAKVGIIQRDKVDVEDKDIVVAMLHSLSQKDYPEEIFKGFIYCIIDESHHIASEMFSKALPKVSCKYTLGLSATPLRKDGLSPVFFNYLGPLFYVERRKGTNRVWIKYLEITSFSRYFDLEMNHYSGSKDTGKMITNISNYETLNYLVLEIVRLLLAQQPRQILVLGARRDQLEWLNETCQEMGIKNYKQKYVTSGLYYGNLGMNKKVYWDMMEKSATCDVIWGTNEIAKEGLDIPTLNTLILLSGGHDVEQAVGRILRKHHEAAPPLVIDMVYKCGNFPKHAISRRNYYASEDYIIHKHQMEIGLSQSNITDLSPKLAEFLANFPEPDGPGVIKVKKNKNRHAEIEAMVNQALPISSRTSLAGKPKKPDQANAPIPIVKPEELTGHEDFGLHSEPKINWPTGCLIKDDDNENDKNDDNQLSSVIPLQSKNSQTTSVVSAVTCSKKKTVAGPPASRVTLPTTGIRKSSSNDLSTSTSLLGVTKITPIAPKGKGRRLQ